jgi:hypothetical protein
MPRRSEPHLTQFLHNSQRHLPAYVAVFVRTLDRGLGDEGRYDAVIDAADASTSMKARACIRIYGRNSRVTLMTNARVDSSDQRSPSAPVFRSSVYTTNSSLPGAHSHRSRKFPLTV